MLYFCRAGELNNCFVDEKFRPKVDKASIALYINIYSEGNSNIFSSLAEILTHFLVCQG